MKIVVSGYGPRKFLEMAIAAVLVVPLVLASTTEADASDTGLYAGLLAGISSTTVDRQEQERELNAALAEVGLSGRLTTVDTKDAASKVFGGYRVSRHWAFEAAFMNLWEVTEGFAVTSGVSATADAQASGVSPLFGLGAQVRLSDRLSLRAEWERVMKGGDENKTGQADFNVYTVGLQHAFQ